ncbi:MAG: ABC transporter substrate-binding protein [Anaerolineales bacterium]|nr:ABC transporter substrate-binding protein [Anaerolineales bacterium]
MKIFHSIRGGIVAGSILVSLLIDACGGDVETKTYTVGVINPSPHLDQVVDGFKEGMSDLGYVEGENITYLYAGPTAIDQHDFVAQGLVNSNVDLILSLTTSATQAVQRATASTKTPIVFIPVTDPVGANIVKSLTYPGGNITGVTYTSQEELRLRWLLQAAPEVERVYIVYNPEDPSPVLALESVQESASRLGVELVTRQANTPEDIEAAFENIPEDIDAILFLPDSVITEKGIDWFAMANKRGLPTSGPSVNTLKDGALTAYGIDLPAAAKEQAARLADQIFRGISPADLPVEFADYYSGINLNVANRINLDIPENVLEQADIIIR